MSQIIYQVDAFTSQPFRGNPAGVCPLPEPAAEKWMQQLAAEMNLSETAFLVRQAEGFNLRWFTPAAEVDLCGHATLASAHILWETDVLAEGETARFHTRSGLLTASKSRDWIEMDFPAKPEQAAAPPPGMLEALGVEAVYIGRSQFDYLVVVKDEGTVRNVQPDMGRLKVVDARGIIVTSRADGNEYDFVSRFFAPAVGVPEDPVTGSAHCCLAPYWSQHLGKREFTAYQASARGGVVRCAVQGERVLLAGQAVTVLRGEIAV
jgi:PhzF family phenazine biosynthesis protein